MEQITHFHKHHQQLPAKLTSVILQICHCQLQDSTWTHPFPSHQPFVTMTHSSKLNWEIAVTKKPSHSPPSSLSLPSPRPPPFRFSSLSLLRLGCSHITRLYHHHYISHTLVRLTPSPTRSSAPPGLEFWHSCFRTWHSAGIHKFQLNEKINQLPFE